MKIKKVIRFMKQIAEQVPDADICSIDIHAEGKAVTVYTDSGRAFFLSEAST